MGETKIYLGELTKEEVNTIEPLVERLAGLEELLMIVHDSEMKSKICHEITELRTKCDDWFMNISRLNGWEISQEDWIIDFLQRKIWIAKQ